jgi:hypothetical protein
MMKDFVIKAALNPDLETVQCAMSTVDYEKWLREEGALFTQLSEKIVHDDEVVTVTMSASWFEICKRYCMSFLVDNKTYCPTGAVLLTNSECCDAA